LNESEIGQEVPAQIQTANLMRNIITQEDSAQIQDISEALVVITHELLAQMNRMNTD